MTIHALIEMLDRKVVNLSQLSAAAAAIGDVAAVERLTTEIAETDVTLAQLRSLPS
jgi:hypothetical protein